MEGKVLQVITIVISFLALIISGVSLIISYKQMKFQKPLNYDIHTKTVGELPVKLVSKEESISEKDIYKKSSSSEKIGIISLWTEVKITNEGARTFTLENINCSIGYRNSNASTSIYDPEILEGTYSSIDKKLEFPITIKPGHQKRILLKINWPVLNEVTKIFTEDLNKEKVSSFYDLYDYLGKRGVSLHSSKVTKEVRENNNMVVEATKVDLDSSALLNIEIDIAGEENNVIRKHNIGNTM